MSSDQLGAVPRWTWLMSSEGSRTSSAADRHQRHLGEQVEGREDQVELRRLPQAPDVQRRQRHDHRDAAEDVARVVLERREEDGQVVRHEERRDGDRDDVVEGERPPRR